MRSPVRARCLVFAGLCFGVAAFAPLSARADEAEATQLRADIAAGIDEMIAGPEKVLSYDAVEVQGTSAPYDVIIRGLKFTPDPESIADIGDITFKLAPVSAGVYDVSELKLPSSVAAKGPEGGGTFTIGSQSFSGRWSKPLQSFLTMDGNFADLKAVDDAGKEVFAVAGLLIKGDSKETTPGHWDQDATFKMTDLKAGGEDGIVSIAELEAGSEMRNLDMAGFESLMKTIEEISNEAAKAQVGLPPEPMDDGGAPAPDDQSGAPAPDDQSGAPAPEDNTGSTAPQDDSAAGAPSDDGNATPPADDSGFAGGEAESGENKAPPEGEQGQSDTGLTQETQPEPSMPEMGQSEGMPDMGAADAAAAEAAAKMLQTLRDLPTLLGDASSHVTVRGIAFKDPTGKELFNLGEGGIDLGLTGLDQEKAGFRFAYRHLGLKADWATLEGPTETGEPTDGPPQALVDGLVPHDLVIDIRLEDLPGKALWQSFLQTVGSEATSPGMAGAPPDLESAGAFFGMSAVGLLQQSASKLRIVDSRLVNKTSSLSLDGEVKADPAAPMGASGQINIEIVGLDDTIKLVKDSMTGPDAAEQTAPLELLRAFGERRTESDGRTVDRYVLSLDPSGAMLLNGKDFQFLLNAMGGPGGPGGDPTMQPDQGMPDDMQGGEQPGEMPSEELPPSDAPQQ
jgi:hypothetical protein